jgi:hypothetical protein
MDMTAAPVSFGLSPCPPGSRCTCVMRGVFIRSHLADRGRRVHRQADFRSEAGAATHPGETRPRRARARCPMSMSVPPHRDRRMLDRAAEVFDNPDCVESSSTPSGIGSGWPPDTPPTRASKAACARCHRSPCRRSLSTASWTATSPPPTAAPRLHTSPVPGPTTTSGRPPHPGAGQNLLQEAPKAFATAVTEVLILATLTTPTPPWAPASRPPDPPSRVTARSHR